MTILAKILKPKWFIEVQGFLCQMEHFLTEMRNRVEH